MHNVSRVGGIDMSFFFLYLLSSLWGDIGGIGYRVWEKGKGGVRGSLLFFLYYKKGEIGLDCMYCAASH